MKKRLIILVSLFFLLVGCSPFEFTYDIFRVLKKGSTAEIVDLTTEGQEREVVVFPAKIPGYEFVNLGTASYFKMSIESQNIKVAFIEHVNMICGTVFLAMTRGEIGNQVIIVLNSLYLIKFEGAFIAGGDNRMVIPFEVFDEYYNKNSGLYRDYRENYEMSRVSFYYNYIDSPNDGLYRISYDKDLEMISKPEDPIRSGYEFQGWYLETENSNEFDFTSESNRTLSYTILYAKWRKK